MVTAPIDPEREMFVPPVSDVTPLLVRIPLVLERPDPRRERKEEPPIDKFVVDAVMNDVYVDDA